jgi:hypothetical protein
MAMLTGARHADAAQRLFDYYMDKSFELEKSRQYFMAAIALAFALETAILTYLLVEFHAEEDDPGISIPDSVGMADLVQCAEGIDVLNAPVDIPLHTRGDGGRKRPKHIARDAVRKINKFRRLIHPAHAVERSYDPRTFKKRQLKEFRDMFESVLHSLLHHI